MDEELVKFTNYLLEFANNLNLHTVVPHDGRWEDALLEHCQDDECLFWDMTYNLQNDILALIERIESESSSG